MRTSLGQNSCLVFSFQGWKKVKEGVWSKLMTNQNVPTVYSKVSLVALGKDKARWCTLTKTTLVKPLTKKLGGGDLGMRLYTSWVAVLYTEPQSASQFTVLHNVLRFPSVVYTSRCILGGPCAAAVVMHCSVACSGLPHNNPVSLFTN